MLKNHHSKHSGKTANYYTNKNILANYDIDKYKIFTQSQQIAIAQLQQLIKEKKISTLSGTVIDIGCGTGNALLELTKTFNFNQIYGIDLSADMLKIAQTKITNLIPICDSAINLNKHFLIPTANLLNLHFLFAYVDYNILISQASRIIHNGGIISICTTTTNSFTEIQRTAIRKFSRLVNTLFKVDLQTIQDCYSNIMPLDLTSITQAVEQNGFKILASEPIRIKIKLTNWQETWNFIYNAGWFVEALHRYKIHKFKAFCLFSLWKAAHIFTGENGNLEDEMEVAVLTAIRQTT